MSVEKKNACLARVRTKFDHREGVLDDVVQMVSLCAEAIALEKQRGKNNEKSKNVKDKQNERKNGDPMQNSMKSNA